MTTTVSKNYTHYINDNIEISTNPENDLCFNVYVVYYINCLVNKNYLSWVKNQLKYVEHFNAKIYITATIEKESENEFKTFCNQNFKNIIDIEFNSENLYEYPGINYVWKLGQIYNSPTDIIFYFHSKGITRMKNYTTLFFDNFFNFDIDLVKEIFSIFPSISKIGLDVGEFGWIWYNYWFARGSYINKVEKPKITSDRHYYEYWLARIENVNDDIMKKEGLQNIFIKNSLLSCYRFGNLYDIDGNIGNYYDTFINQTIRYDPNHKQLKLFDNIRTDKNSVHSYLDLYDYILSEKRLTATNILEVGIGPNIGNGNGGSIKMWHDYFTAANIYALDTIPLEYVWKELHDNPRIKLFTSTDAYNHNFFTNEILNKNIKFDMILDDGPHTLQSMISFIRLYSQVLKSDGILIIEDVQHVSWIEILRNEVPENLKEYIEVHDLRFIKNRYDDIVFTINKSKKMTTKKISNFLMIPIDLAI